MKFFMLPMAFLVFITGNTKAQTIPTFTSFTPVSACAGMTITINGTNFTNPATVFIGGISASSVTVVSSTKITAVVAANATGKTIEITTNGYTLSRSEFYFITTTGIITDYKGYWNSDNISVNPINPDDAHQLLAFTYCGTNYSTGVNNNILNSKGISFTSTVFKALPIAGVAGITPASPSNTYIALAKKVDGSDATANASAVSSYSIKSVLVDGINGLNLGTGVTNLPSSAIFNFDISNIDPTRIADAEPDIILTQIAQPESGNDVFGFTDASGNYVGNTVSQDMTLLPRLGTYILDLFNLTPGTPYNTATVYSAYTANTTRDIRLVAFKLSDFGITSGNIGQVKSFKVTPSSNSDYAFIAYNTNAVNLPPTVSIFTERTNTAVCSSGTATMTVIATPATIGNTITYSWEESIDGGTTWNTIANGGKYSGAFTSQLSVKSPVNGYQYRARVSETGNTNSVTSAVCTITILPNPAPPASVTISGSDFCINALAQLTSTTTGGTNLYYQWQSNALGSFQDIPGANWSTLDLSTNQPSAVSYRLCVSSGNGCTPAISNTRLISVTQLQSITGGSACLNSSATLKATALPEGATINWYDASSGGTLVGTGNAFTTPALSSTRTYYAVSSGCANRSAAVATIQPVSGGTLSGGGEVTSGTNSTMLLLNNVVGNIIKWQSSTDNFTSTITDIYNTTNQYTAINLTHTTQYRACVQNGACTANSSTATVTVLSPLPILNGSVKVIKEKDSILVQWVAYDQSNTEAFEIEKSSDGKHFFNVQHVLPIDTVIEKYQWKDIYPSKGSNFYRIKEILKSGGYNYSNVVNILFEHKSIDISILPNPVTNRKLTLLLNNAFAGRYQVRLINISGQVVYEENLQITSGFTLYPIQIPAQCGKGYFRVFVTSADGFSSSSTMIVL